MKLDMELKPGDMVLLKLLSSLLIFVLIGQFLILPGIRKHQELVTGLILSHNLFPVSLSIGDTYAEVPAAYFLSRRAANAAAAAAAEASAADMGTLLQTEYTNITPVTVSIRGTGENIRAFLNDIALNCPGLQVRSFSMNSGTYVSDALQIVGSTDVACTLYVYSCGDRGASGEETNQ